MEFTVGGSEMDAYVPLLEEELAISGEDHRAPGWHKGSLAPDVEFSVAIIGAGMSGLLAAHRLQQAGVPFVVLEKNDDVGGTWWENTYPGCRVDNPNHLYSYSFAQKHDWPQHFSTQGALQQYFATCADDLDLRRHVRFGTEVVSARFDETSSSWTLEVRTAEGNGTVVAQAVISAVGQLNRPKLPDIAGRDRFGGPSFHSARWDHDVDLRGKRVAVIGNGASAAQFIPVIADDVAELRIFQRTPNWFGPTPDYHEEVSDGQRWLYTHVPFYSEWHRFWIFWRTADGVLPNVTVDPAWEGHGLSVSEANELARLLLTAYLEAEFADRPELLAQVVPTYPVGAKRILRDNGIWARTLKRPHVQLVTEKITEITPTGIVTGDGQEHEVDVVIYGTGFQASRFLCAHGGVRPQRGGAPRAVGGQRPGLPRHHHPRLPEPVLPLRAEHQHRDQRQHRVLLGVRGALRAGLPPPAVRERPRRARLPPRRARRVQRGRRCRERPDGLGRVVSEQLVQERPRAGLPELALHAAGVLAADQGRRPRRLRLARLAPRRQVGTRVPSIDRCRAPAQERLPAR